MVLNTYPQSNRNPYVANQDVERIRYHALVPASIPVCGYVYDVKTGKLIEIEEATKIGVAS